MSSHNFAVVQLPDGSSYPIKDQESWRWLLYNYYGKDDYITHFIDVLSSQVPNLGKWTNEWKSEYNSYNDHSANNDMNGFYGEMGLSGITPTATTEKSIDNDVSRENVVQDQSYQTSMRDTSYLSAGSQLQQLGLTSSGVLQTGGATSGVSSTPASASHMSAAALKQQRDINAYNQKMSMARSIIGMVGQMASSGIYGSAIGAARHSAATLAASTAHSGLQALNSMRPELRDQLMKDAAARHQDYASNQPNKLAGL